VEVKLGDVEDGYGASFTLGSDRCDQYLLNAYGVDKEAFVRFLQNSRRR
jgi:hypothetical protein